VSLSARDLNLGAATARAFTSTVDNGTLEMVGGGTFRALGTRLVFPKDGRPASVGGRQRGAISRSGEGRGPVAPPVFKTGLSLLVGDGRFDSFPSPPILRFFCSFGGHMYLQLLNR